MWAVRNTLPSSDNSLKPRILKRKIKKLTADGQFGRALLVFRTLFQDHSPDLVKEVIILQGKYNRLREDIKVSLLDEKREMDLIAASLHNFTRKIDKQFIAQVPESTLLRIEALTEADKNEFS